MTNLESETLSLVLKTVYMNTVNEYMNKGVYRAKRVDVRSNLICFMSIKNETSSKQLFGLNFDAQH